jgi:cell division septation protein DedD
MDHSTKNIWWILLLIAAGVVIFALALGTHAPKSDPGVVLSDIFRPQTSKKDPVPPMAIVTTPVAGQETTFTIQVYSFQDKRRAQTALQALKNSGYSAFLIMSDLGEKGIWWRVRVGPIEDEASAHKMLNEIRKNYNSGFILKPGQ